MATITQSQKVRLRSLDVLRGFDMFFIMGGDVLLLSLCWLFPGSWGDCVAAQLGHPAWHGALRLMISSFRYSFFWPAFLFPFLFPSKWTMGVHS